jgi:translation initiation factor 5A
MHDVRQPQVVDVSTSKTGKHGHAKANITGIDIFTGKKYEDVAPTSHNLAAPLVKRTEYQLVDIDDSDTTEDGAICSLMNPETGETLDDLRIPSDEEYNNLREAHKEDKKDLLVMVLEAMGQRKVLSQFTMKDR